MYSKHSTKSVYSATELKEALLREEFELYYQPKIDLATGRIHGVEGLLRWNTSQGVISPLDFISLAEDTGLIIPIGEWVLKTACQQLATWQKSGWHPLVMAVNLSVRQLHHPYFADMVASIIKDSDISPECLELEVTESMMMDGDQSLHVLRELRQIGVRISVDDFGTGYSSLRYLKQYPITRIKIDQSFVATCTEDLNDEAIVKTIIAMAHQLKIEITAEGVESRAHLVFLQQHGCNEG